MIVDSLLTNFILSVFINRLIISIKELVVQWLHLAKSAGVSKARHRLIIWRSQVQALAGPRFYYSDLCFGVGRCFLFDEKYDHERFTQKTSSIHPILQLTLWRNHLGIGRRLPMPVRLEQNAMCRTQQTPAHATA